MSNPHADGPRAPDAVPAPPEHRVTGLIPFVHVDDVERSIAFYQHLGFVVTSIYKYRGTPVWAALQSEGAELMVTRDGDPIDPAGQGILFYLYSPDLAVLRAQLLKNGVEAGEIEDGTPGPRQEMKVTDPDGYVLMVAQIEPDEPDSAPLDGSLGESDAAGEDFQSEDERADHTDLPEQGDRV
jgi:catechol 2,3-dioxygenase-like lactoylglutathione lyase family enzyme